MKQLLYILAAFCISGISCTMASAQEEVGVEVEYPRSEEDAYPGMEVLEIGQTKVLVPKDSKVRKAGGLILLEDSEKYLSRRLLELEERIDTLTAQQSELTAQMAALKEMLRQIEERSRSSAEE